jgi:hypothetical protein
MTYSTDIHNDKILEASLNEANKTVIFSIYGTQMEDFSAHHSYVSFGNPGDGFYRKTDYLSWFVLFMKFIVFFLCICIGSHYIRKYS